MLCSGAAIRFSEALTLTLKDHWLGVRQGKECSRRGKLGPGGCLWGKVLHNPYTEITSDAVSSRDQREHWVFLVWGSLSYQRRKVSGRLGSHGFDVGDGTPGIICNYPVLIIATSTRTEYGAWTAQYLLTNFCGGNNCKQSN